MTLPTDERLRAIMLEIKSLGGIQAFAAETRISVRTVYRQLEDGPPRLNDTTRAEIVRVLEVAGAISALIGVASILGAILAGPATKRRDGLTEMPYLAPPQSGPPDPQLKRDWET